MGTLFIGTLSKYISIVAGGAVMGANSLLGNGEYDQHFP